MKSTKCDFIVCIFAMYVKIEQNNNLAIIPAKVHPLSLAEKKQFYKFMEKLV